MERTRQKNLYAFLCIDYLKPAKWNTTYSGFAYGIADIVPGKSQSRLVEAAYLTGKLMSRAGLRLAPISTKAPSVSRYGR